MLTDVSGVGSLIGIVICNISVDRIYKRLQLRSTDNKPKPENRLPLTIVGASTLPFVVAGYGWVAQAHLPVPVLLLSVVLLGVCILLSVVPIMAYVVDAFGMYSASSLTAVLIARCLMGTFLPLATAPLTERLGYGYGYMVLAALCLVIAPIPLVVFRHGERWRQQSTYTQDREDVSSD